MMDPLEHLQMLKDRAAGVVPRSEDLQRARSLCFTRPGFDRTRWREMCRMGSLGQQTAVQFRGVAEELGARIAPEPLVAAAMAARLLPPAHLAPVLAGERVILPAWQEAGDGLDLADEVRFHDGRLSGRKRLIPMAAGADAFLVTVRDGTALVEPGATGVALDLEDSEDGGHFGTLTLDDATSEWIGGDAAVALEHAIMGSSAYLLGLMDRAFAITVQAMRTASFSAPQHRVDDMQLQLALTRTVVEAAALALDTAATLVERRAAVSRARLRASDAAMVVTRTCLQLHGGIGHPGAHDIGLYWRKAMVLSPLYGGSRVHRSRVRA